MDSKFKYRSFSNDPFPLNIAYKGDEANEKPFRLDHKATEEEHLTHLYNLTHQDLYYRVNTGKKKKLINLDDLLYEGVTVATSSGIYKLEEEDDLYEDETNDFKIFKGLSGQNISQMFVVYDYCKRRFKTEATDFKRDSIDNLKKAFEKGIELLKKNSCTAERAQPKEADPIYSEISSDSSDTSSSDEESDTSSSDEESEAEESNWEEDITKEKERRVIKTKFEDFLLLRDVNEQVDKKSVKKRKKLSKDSDEYLSYEKLNAQLRDSKEDFQYSKKKRWKSVINFTGYNTSYALFLDTFLNKELEAAYVKTISVLTKEEMKGYKFKKFTGLKVTIADDDSKLNHHKCILSYTGLQTNIDSVWEDTLRISNSIEGGDAITKYRDSWKSRATFRVCYKTNWFQDLYLYKIRGNGGSSGSSYYCFIDLYHLKQLHFQLTSRETPFEEALLNFVKTMSEPGRQKTPLSVGDNGDNSEKNLIEEIETAFFEGDTFYTGVKNALSEYVRDYFKKNKDDISKKTLKDLYPTKFWKTEFQQLSATRQTGLNEEDGGKTIRRVLEEYSAKNEPLTAYSLHVPVKKMNKKAKVYFYYPEYNNKLNRGINLEFSQEFKRIKRPDFYVLLPGIVDKTAKGKRIVWTDKRVKSWLLSTDGAKGGNAAAFANVPAVSEMQGSKGRKLKFFGSDWARGKITEETKNLSIKLRKKDWDEDKKPIDSYLKWIYDQTSLNNINTLNDIVGSEGTTVKKKKKFKLAMKDYKARIGDDANLAAVFKDALSEATIKEYIKTKKGSVSFRAKTYFVVQSGEVMSVYKNIKARTFSYNAVAARDFWETNFTKLEDEEKVKLQWYNVSNLYSNSDTTWELFDKEKVLEEEDEFNLSNSDLRELGEVAVGTSLEKDESGYYTYNQNYYESLNQKELADATNIDEFENVLRCMFLEYCRFIDYHKDRQGVKEELQDRIRKGLETLKLLGIESNNIPCKSSDLDPLKSSTELLSTLLTQGVVALGDGDGISLISRKQGSRTLLTKWSGFDSLNKLNTSNIRQDTINVIAEMTSIESAESISNDDDNSDMEVDDPIGDDESSTYKKVLDPLDGKNHDLSYYIVPCGSVKTVLYNNEEKKLGVVFKSPRNTEDLGKMIESFKHELNSYMESYKIEFTVPDAEKDDEEEDDEEEDNVKGDLKRFIDYSSDDDAEDNEVIDDDDNTRWPAIIRKLRKRLRSFLTPSGFANTLDEQRIKNFRLKNNPNLVKTSEIPPKKICFTLAPPSSIRSTIPNVKAVDALKENLCKFYEKEFKKFDRNKQERNWFISTAVNVESSRTSEDQVSVALDLVGSMKLLYDMLNESEENQFYLGESARPLSILYDWEVPLVSVDLVKQSMDKAEKEAISILPTYSNIKAQAINTATKSDTLLAISLIYDNVYYSTDPINTIKMHFNVNNHLSQRNLKKLEDQLKVIQIHTSKKFVRGMEQLLRTKGDETSYLTDGNQPQCTLVKNTILEANKYNRFYSFNEDGASGMEVRPGECELDSFFSSYRLHTEINYSDYERQKANGNRNKIKLYKSRSKAVKKLLDNLLSTFLTGDGGLVKIDDFLLDFWGYGMFSDTGRELYKKLFETEKFSEDVKAVIEKELGDAITANDEYFKWEDSTLNNYKDEVSIYEEAGTSLLNQVWWFHDTFWRRAFGKQYYKGALTRNNTEIENWISKYRYEALKKEAVLDIVYKNRIKNWQSRAEHFGNGYAEDFTYLYGLDIDKIMGGARKGGLHLKVEDGVVKPDQKGKNSISDKKRTLFYRQISTFHNTVNVEGKDNSTRIRNIPHYDNKSWWGISFFAWMRHLCTTKRSFCKLFGQNGVDENTKLNVVRDNFFKHLIYHEKYASGVGVQGHYFENRKEQDHAEKSRYAKKLRRQLIYMKQISADDEEKYKLDPNIYFRVQDDVETSRILEEPFLYKPSIISAQEIRDAQGLTESGVPLSLSLFSAFLYGLLDTDEYKENEEAATRNKMRKIVNTYMLKFSEEDGEFKKNLQQLLYFIYEDNNKNDFYGEMKVSSAEEIVGEGGCFSSENPSCFQPITWLYKNTRLYFQLDYKTLDKAIRSDPTSNLIDIMDAYTSSTNVASPLRLENIKVENVFLLLLRDAPGNDKQLPELYKKWKTFLWEDKFAEYKRTNDRIVLSTSCNPVINSLPESARVLFCESTSIKSLQDKDGFEDGITNIFTRLLTGEDSFYVESLLPNGTCVVHHITVDKRYRIPHSVNTGIFNIDSLKDGKILWVGMKREGMYNGNNPDINLFLTTKSKKNHAYKKLGSKTDANNYAIHKVYVQEVDAVSMQENYEGKLGIKRLEISNKKLVRPYVNVNILQQIGSSMIIDEYNGVKPEKVNSTDLRKVACIILQYVNGLNKSDAEEAQGQFLLYFYHFLKNFDEITKGIGLKALIQDAETSQQLEETPEFLKNLINKNEEPKEELLQEYAEIMLQKIKHKYYEKKPEEKKKKSEKKSDVDKKSYTTHWGFNKEKPPRLIINKITQLDEKVRENLSSFYTFMNNMSYHFLAMCHLNFSIGRSKWAQLDLAQVDFKQSIERVKRFLVISEIDKFIQDESLLSSFYFGTVESFANLPLVSISRKNVQMFDKRAVGTDLFEAYTGKQQLSKERANDYNKTKQLILDALPVLSWIIVNTPNDKDDQENFVFTKLNVAQDFTQRMVTKDREYEYRNCIFVDQFYLRHNVIYDYKRIKESCENPLMFRLLFMEYLRAYKRIMFDLEEFCKTELSNKKNLGTLYLLEKNKKIKTKYGDPFKILGTKNQKVKPTVTVQVVEYKRSKHCFVCKNNNEYFHIPMNNSCLLFFQFRATLNIRHDTVIQRFYSKILQCWMVSDHLYAFMNSEGKLLLEQERKKPSRESSYVVNKEIARLARNSNSLMITPNYFADADVKFPCYPYANYQTRTVKTKKRKVLDANNKVSDVNKKQKRFLNLPEGFAELSI